MKASTLLVLLAGLLGYATAFSSFDYVESLNDVDISSLDDVELHGLESANYFYERQAELGLQAGASFGVDYSELFSVNTLTCLKRNGHSFVIPRGFTSLGYVDGNLNANIRNAVAAGMPYIDTYFFPCPTCGNPAGQWNKLTSFVDANRLKIGMVWLDIEGAQYWLGNAIANRNFFENLLAAVVKSGWKVGIYSSKYMWESIFGSGYTRGGNYPIWYAHYDNSPSFSDWVPFGGFRTPAIKQYLGDTWACSASVDLNYY